MSAASSNISKAVDSIGFGYYHIRFSLLLGFSLSVETMELTLLAFVQSCIALDWDLTTTQESLLTSSAILGQIVGMLAFGPVADFYGRRVAILIGWIFIGVFGLISCFSEGFWFLSTTRFLVGIGVGGVPAVSFDLLAESIPSKYRSNVILLHAFGVLGTVFVITMSLLLLENYGWRWLMFACTLPVFPVFYYGYCYMDESPRWLVMQGRLQQATDILNNAARINQIAYRVDETTFSSNATITLPPAGHKFRNQYSALFSRKYRKITLILWVLWFCFNFCNNYVFYMSVVVFATSGSCSYEYGYLYFTDTIGTFGTIFALITISYYGRGNMQLFSYCLFTICSVWFAVMYEQGHDAFTIATFLATCLTLGVCVPSSWLHTTEIYPTEIRSTGHTMAALVGRIGAVGAIMWVDNFAYDNILWGITLVAALGTLAAICANMLPETTDVQLDSKKIVKRAGQFSNPRRPRRNSHASNASDATVRYNLDGNYDDENSDSGDSDEEGDDRVARFGFKRLGASSSADILVDKEDFLLFGDGCDDVLSYVTKKSGNNNSNIENDEEYKSDFLEDDYRNADERTSLL